MYPDLPKLNEEETALLTSLRSMLTMAGKHQNLPLGLVLDWNGVLVNIAKGRKKNLKELLPDGIRTLVYSKQVLGYQE